ncbi:sugar kinase [Agromyces tardus]|uniref:Sugar kinase n=1 Tax=Agromyces tardus TaxID=2583849 RepID=A0A3M8AMR0_9MICO|nr:PfkB family carbohydrate kinase [Agromyces tardus]RNB51775.1 sugar kinase [Agromyces tardus]
MSQPIGSPANIVVVGDALIDELRDATGSRDFVGGAALNVAVGLAVLGHRPTLVAMVGDDAPGDEIRSFLAEHGVDLVASPSPHGTSRAVSDRTDGEPRYEFNEAAQRRALRFDEATLDAFDEADLVVVSCFPFDDEAQYRALVDAIARPAERVVVDGNPRSGMMHDRARFLDNFLDFASRSLVAKIGDDDAELLLDAPLSEFVDRILAVGDPAVLATAGRDGAAVHHRGSAVRAGIVPLDGPVIDTMGGGDATLAAITHEIATAGVPSTDAEWQAALEHAMRIAAATVRAEGALLRVPPEA